MCDFMVDGFVHSTCNSLLVCLFLQYNLLWTHSNQQATLITVHKSIYHKSQANKFMTVLLQGDKKAKWLFIQSRKCVIPVVCVNIGKGM